jgi:DNA mismatch repair protein MSH2
LARKSKAQDWYSCHGGDALLVAEQVFKTNNVVKYLGSSSSNRGLPSVTISSALTKMFLRDCLTSKQMRVEIYEAEEHSGRRNNARWQVGKTASPGNISQLEDLLFSNTDLVASAVSMAIKRTKDGVGCAFVDVQEKTITVAEFVDDENYGNTEVRCTCTGLISVSSHSAGG